MSSAVELFLRLVKCDMTVLTYTEYLDIYAACGVSAVTTVLALFFGVLL